MKSEVAPTIDEIQVNPIVNELQEARVERFLAEKVPQPRDILSKSIHSSRRIMHNSEKLKKK